MISGIAKPMIVTAVDGQGLIDQHKMACAVLGVPFNLAAVPAPTTVNPLTLVIGGGVAEAGKVLFDKVKETISSRAMCVQAAHVKVLKAALGNDAGMQGAAILVKESLGRSA